MEYTIPYPYIWRRKSVQPYELHRGSVVAFKTRDRQPCTGIVFCTYPNLKQRKSCLK